MNNPITCQNTYETGLLYHHYANTAYPLTPASFLQYRIKDQKEILDFVTSEWALADELSLYIHIPFCKARCKFCEYVVLDQNDESLENDYTQLLLKEMKMYAGLLQGKKIVGFDLGGGTPTKLSVTNLKQITEAVNDLFNIDKDVIFSIETTPTIAAEEPEKIQAVYDLGYRRISMGIQTVSDKLLAELGREGNNSIYENAVKNIRKAGFERVNIDLMYGFLYQSDIDLEHTLKYAVGLKPEYITLYRNRYKGTKIESEAGGVSIYKAMRQYNLAYRTLTEHEYGANTGKNTFSRVAGDYGTSDYLTKRVIDGVPYVGMGLGAQSFGMNYLAYNEGAVSKKMERYRRAINEGRLPIQDLYRLPVAESIAKMVSVAFYFGFIDFDSFEHRFHLAFEEQFPDELAYVLEHELMKMEGRRLTLTGRGADYINGVIPLFYSDRSKIELQDLLEKSNPDAAAKRRTDEKLFLASYDIADYDRPSLTTDIVALAIRSVENKDNYRKSPDTVLSILLIKRGEHPYMNAWALPGGFVRMDETIEECAYRELQEETGVETAALMPIGTFSKPDRDPRGRIISSAFISIIGEDDYKIMSGDDAIDARWFDVAYDKKDGDFFLTLTCEEIILTAQLRETQRRFNTSHFEIIDADGFAFDHASIISCALTQLRNSVQDFDVAFDFLPPLFTMNLLQKVHETILNVSLLPANFRRKAVEYVEETKHTDSKAGHRPAKLYSRKDIVSN